MSSLGSTLFKLSFTVIILMFNFTLFYYEYLIIIEL
jgi:hypothetical protein